VKRTVTVGGQRIEFTLIQARRQDVLIQALEGGLTRVYAPKSARLADVDELVRGHAGQILSMREALKPGILADGDVIRVEGAPRAVRIEKGPARAEITESEAVIYVPDPGDPEAARSVLRAALSARALRRIRERIAHFLPVAGGAPGRITVRAQKSRWGSCSSKGNLSFNWRLILAPPDCLDYVVAHELCHLTEFNHSPRFWKLVETCKPDYRVWQAYLKKNGRGLIL
jgi:predicted metal-dependent hydrolase